jgi:O-antigen/teichoic acid export membrane protein
LIAEEANTDVARRVARNYALLGAAQVATMALGLFSVVSVARHYGASEYGKLAFAIALTSWFALVPESLVALGIRELARRRSETPRFAATITVLRLTIALACFVGLLAFSLPFVHDGETLLLALILGVNFIVQTLDLGWTFNAHEAMGYPSASKTIGQLAYSVSVVALVFVSAPLWLVAVARCAATISTVLLSYAFFLQHRGSPRLTIGRDEYTSLLTGALPITLSYAMGQAYLVTGVVLLGFFATNEAVGWYSAANRIVLGGVVPFSYLYFDSVYPLLSRRFQASPEHAGQLIEQSVKLMLAVGLPIALAGSILSPKIISTLYGPSYAPSAAPFRLIVWAAAATFLSQALSSPLLSLDRQRMYARNIGVGLLVNLATNVILIPRLGLIGVALATLATEITVLVLGGHEVSRTVPYAFWRHVPRPAFAAAAMGLVLLPIASRSIFVTIPVGVAVYVVALVLVGGVGATELTVIRSMATLRARKEAPA